MSLRCTWLMFAWFCLVFQDEIHAYSNILLEERVHVKEESTITSPSFGGKIKRIIALMFENRSFDHLLGYLRLKRDNTTKSVIHFCLI